MNNPNQPRKQVNTRDLVEVQTSTGCSPLAVQATTTIWLGHQIWFSIEMLHDYDTTANQTIPMDNAVYRRGPGSCGGDRKAIVSLKAW